jgi:YidC/Oxa1 family membrane protein insertase
MDFINKYITPVFLEVLTFFHNNISFGDLGVAIIFFTIFIRILLLPFFYKTAKDQAIMQKLNPHIQKIREVHKDDKAKQGEAMLELYKKHKVNPFSNFLLILLQLPIFIALFNLFSKEIANAHFASTYFLNIIDLTQKNIYIVLLAAIFQFWQSKIMLKNVSPDIQNEKKEDTQQTVSKIMLFVGPIITIIVFMNFPAAIGLYWATFSAFSFFQQIYINKKINKSDTP